MAVFQVNGTTVPLVGQPRLRWQDLAAYRARFSGKVGSETRSAASKVRVWQGLETDYLTDAEAADLLADLTGVSAFTISGELIGSTVTCRAENVDHPMGPLDDMAKVTFDALEVLAS